MSFDKDVAQSLGLQLDQKFLSVKGKTALITGASSGLGKIFAARLYAEGCNVVIAARRKPKLNDLLTQLAALSTTPPAQACSVQLDVQGSEAEIDAAVGEAWDVFGGFDILVNNAGYFEVTADPSIKTTWERSSEAWDTVLSINLRGVGLVVKSAVKRMISGGRKGSIINISSIAGIERGINPGAGIYAASKAGLIQLTKTLALELGPHGIRANCIAPGLFESEMTAGVWDRVQEKAKAVVPVERWGKADHDLTAPLLLLASDSSSYITGVTITVDGGTTLKRPSYW